MRSDKTVIRHYGSAARMKIDTRTIISSRVKSMRDCNQPFTILGTERCVRLSEL